MTKVVDTEQLNPNGDHFSDLAIAKNGTVYVSWMRCTGNGPSGNCGGTRATFWVSKSADGGNTKIGSANLVPSNCSCAFFGSLPNTHVPVSNIPVIDVDNSTGSFAGHLYVVNYNWTGTYMKVQVTTSTDGGTTWDTPKGVGSSNNHDQFFPWLTVSKTGTVGVTWLDRRNDPGNVSYQAYAALSTNGGTSFGTNHKLATASSNPNNDGFGGSNMGDYTGNIWAGNTLYASWMDTRNGTNCQDEVGGYVQ